MRIIYFTLIALKRLCFFIKQTFCGIFLFFSSCWKKSKPSHRIRNERCPVPLSGNENPKITTESSIPMKASSGGHKIVYKNKCQHPHRNDSAVAADGKKQSGKDKYMELFLSKPPTKLRRQRTFMLEEELYIKISRMIRYMPGGITFPGFLINVINHHFEQYKDEVNEMLRSIADDMYKSE